MHRLRSHAAPPPPRDSALIPDGWHPINPSYLDSKQPSKRTEGSSRQDELGLAKGVHPVQMRVPRILEQDVGGGNGKLVRSSPRHRKLQQNDHHSASRNQATTTGAASLSPPHCHVADAFAPNGSLRLASLKPLASTVGSPTVSDTRQAQRNNHGKRETNNNQHPSATARHARLRDAPLTIVPLHEAVRGFDEAVEASPLAESNQVAVTELFLTTWMERFECDRPLYKSIVVHAEIAFKELYRLTANLAHPNDLVTAFACRILDDMVALFGPYSLIMEALATELRSAIYAAPDPPVLPTPLPYFALVKHQKRILHSLRQDLVRRRDRNDFLRYEIDKVHATFRHFLDQCGLGLVRTVFREWYSVAVISKRNSKKYIEYFSAWFGGSAKALVPRVFLAWKHVAIERRIASMHSQLASDNERLAALQKQVDELGVQRDIAQLESLAIRNDRKQAEDTIQRLHRKIQSASSFLETSHRREPLVATEGQLRVEAATFLPPLVLESLMRSVHGVGFLQPLHGEFALDSHDDKRGHTVLQKCITAICGRTPTSRPDKDKDIEQPMLPDLSVEECASFVESVTHHVEDDRTAHLLFLSAREMQRDLKNEEEEEDDEGGNGDEDDGGQRKIQRLPEDLVRAFFKVQERVRRQNEHYARHTKLFSSRMLKHNEISVAPLPLPRMPIAQQAMEETIALPMIASMQFLLASDLGVINGVRRFSLPLLAIDQATSHDELPATSLENVRLLQPEDFVLSSLHARAFARLTLAQLVGAYGSLLFSPSDLSPFAKNRVLQKVMLHGIAGAKHQLLFPLDSGHSEQDAKADDTDDDDDEEHDNQDDAAETDVPGTKPQRRMIMAPHRASSYRGLHAPIARGIDRGLSAIITAYEIWNRLSRQLVDAELVQARATISLTSDETVSPEATAGVKTPSEHAIAMLRPRLHLHIEPLAAGVLMTAAKDKDRTSCDPPTTPTGGHQRSMALAPPDGSYDTAKIRRLSLDDTQQLTAVVRSLHESVVKSTAQQRDTDFTRAKETLKTLRLSQWQHACDLANQFLDVPGVGEHTATKPSTETTSSRALSSFEDDRSHVFECLSFDNDGIHRLFSVEPQPMEELARVHAVLERKKHVVRHALYTKHRPGMTHAATLEDLWHVVKLLRLPRDVRVLPPMRDDELLQGYEQLFSSDDLTEVLLQLSNEQFLPHVTPLSARVELLVTHHLSLAIQNQSTMREIMHKSDVKKALAEHAQTLRTIFRRYCAKEKELMAAAAVKRRAAVVAASTGSAISSFSSTPTPTPPGSSSSSSSANSGGNTTTGSHAAHGITKFMRLANWHEFISDYKLLRVRFTLEYATTVFRNVQEAESGLEDHLEMIYGEFCEAVVALSVCFFPDPFLQHGVRVNQFIRRYLPVSPEEIRDHHI